MTLELPMSLQCTSLPKCFLSITMNLTHRRKEIVTLCTSTSGMIFSIRADSKTPRYRKRASPIGNVSGRGMPRHEARRGEVSVRRASIGERHIQQLTERGRASGKLIVRTTINPESRSVSTFSFCPRPTATPYRPVDESNDHHQHSRP